MSEQIESTTFWRVIEGLASSIVFIYGLIRWHLYDAKRTKDMEHDDFKKAIENLRVDMSTQQALISAEVAYRTSINERLDELMHNQRDNMDALVNEFKQMRESFDAFICAQYRRPIGG